MPFLKPRDPEILKIIGIFARFTRSEGDEVNLRPFVTLLYECRTHAKGFIIGMCEYCVHELCHIFSIMGAMTDGIIFIDKPAGMTSFGVVARVRRVLSREASKKTKVGHTGTLDPFATGLMILVVGKECRNAGTYTKLDKVYEATFRLGQVSTTGDPEGELTDVSDTQPTREQVDRAVAQFVGKIMQRPPIFSAIKVNGQRAYKLARDGKEVEIPEREIEIFSLEVLNYSYPELTIRTHVSSGTYIRTLGVDIGTALGTGAYCTQLRRTRIAEWDINDAQQLADYGIED